jgi:hypothetical protein
MVFDRKFGVHKLFSKINLPKTNFKFSYGLGVISKDQDLINEINTEFKL